MLARAIRRQAIWGLVASVALLLVPASRVASATPVIAAHYSGTFTPEGGGPESMSMSVDFQHGKTVKFRIFVANEPEFAGKGKIIQNGTVLKATLKATGRHAPKWLFQGTISDNGNALDGPYKLTRFHLPSTTGTFSLTAS